MKVKARVWFNGTAPFEEEWEKPRMIYGVEQLYDGSIDGLGSRGSFGHLLDEPEVYVVMLWSGFEDIKGQDIYEGDIIQLKETTAKAFRRVVSFQDGAFGYMDTSGVFIWMRDLGENFEVLGNVKEDPELVP